MGEGSPRALTATAAAAAAAGWRRRRRTANHQALEATLLGAAVLVWLPYCLAAFIFAYYASFDTTTASTTTSLYNSTAATTKSAASSSTRFFSYLLPHGFQPAVYLPKMFYTLAFSAFAIFSTTYFAVNPDRGGEYLMFIAWIIGIFSDHGWVVTAVAPGASPQRAVELPSGMMLLVAIVSGILSGVLCKVKDISDGRQTRSSFFLRLGFTPSSEATAAAAVVSGGNVSGGRFTGGSADGSPVSSPREAVAAATTTVTTTVRPSEDGRNGKAVPHLPDFTTATEEVVEEEEEIVADAAASGSIRGDKSSTSLRRSISVGGGTTLQHRHVGHSSYLSLGERVYLVVPFCTGQWLRFIIHYGWRGIVVENGIIVLTLGMIGYSMLSVHLLQTQWRNVTGRGGGGGGSGSGGGGQHMRRRTVNRRAVGEDGVERVVTTVVLERETIDDVGVDVIDIIYKLFTTSFGVVVAIIVLLNVLLTFLVIPFLKALSTLNALVNSVGIIFELLVYEIV